MKRILMIVAPSESNPLFPLEQVIEPYYLLRDSGAEVVVASMDGSSPLIRARASKPSQIVLRYRNDERAREALSDMLSLQQVYPEDFRAAFCIGDPAMFEPGGFHTASTLIGQFLMAGKPIAIVATSGVAGVIINGTSPCLTAKALLGALTSAPHA